MSFIIVLKFFDIAFKLTIMQKMSKGDDLNTIIPFDININMILRYMNVLIYPSGFLIANS